MEYTKQTWTAPTGTGLSRYAKSAESASHVTLTLDPVNLTNTPTPFTAERMAHMEEGIAKAYDTAPPTPWAQYSGKDIPQLPDNLAGTTYKRDNDWTTTDGWTASGGTISVGDNKLICISSTGDFYIVKTGFSFSGASNRFILLYLTEVPAGNTAGQVYYSTSGHGISASYYKNFVMTKKGIYILDMGVLSVGGNDWITSTITALRIDFGTQTGQTFIIQSIYIGNGAYDRLVFDNSYHYRHLLNNAVVPTPQGLYFNGTSYLRSKDKVTLPDVFTFSATVNCAVQSDSQFIFSYNPNPVTEEGLIGFYIASNSTTIQSVHRNSSGSSVFTNIGVNALTAGTDVLVEIETNFTTKAFKIYKNNVLFNSGSLTDIVKPPEAIYDIGASNFDYHFLGYMRNICLFDTSLTDTQRNWLAQGNTPPILYDVTNWLALETLRYNTSFLLQPYSDGKKIRIANTHATNTITVTLPSGQTYAGAITSFTLKPYEKIEIELFGTEWDEIGNEGIGTINATGSTTADFGRLLCQGQALSRTTYARLFNRIGTAFGAGDGSTTFNLPDCREVALVGAGTNVLNASAIVTHNALTAGQFQDDQFEEHSHYASTGDQSDSGGSYFLSNGSGSLQTTSNHSLRSGGGIDKYNESSTKTPNFGNTTHGKQLAVNWQIKY